jgi:hypothetical protein
MPCIAIPASSAAAAAAPIAADFPDCEVAGSSAYVSIRLKSAYVSIRPKYPAHT